MEILLGVIRELKQNQEDRHRQDAANERTPLLPNSTATVVVQNGIEQCDPERHPCSICKIWKQDRVSMKRLAIMSLFSQVIFLVCLMLSSLNEGIYSNRCLQWYGKTHDSHVDEGADCPA